MENKTMIKPSRNRALIELHKEVTSSILVIPDAFVRGVNKGTLLALGEITGEDRCVAARELHIGDIVIFTSHFGAELPGYAPDKQVKILNFDDIVGVVKK